MKKGLCLISVLLIVSSLMGSYLAETKTMDTTLFGNLYDAIDFDSGHDEVMRFYWDKWMESASPNPTSRYEGENECRENRATYDPINWAYTYSKNSLIGALAVDIDDDDAQEYLNNVQDHMIYNPEPGHHDRFLKLFSDYVGEESVFGQDIDGDGTWADGEYSDGSWGDCLNYGSLLSSVAFTVDNLWYYNVSNQTDLYIKLEILAGWANELLSESNFDGEYAQCTNPDYPPQLKTSYHNGRIRLAGILGYAGCVLGNAEFIQTAESDLFERPLAGGRNGFLEYMTSNSGTYTEGMSYTEYTFEGLSKFFVARKRMPDGIDWFQDFRVKSIYENSLDLISPTMTFIPFDDVHETYMKNWGTTHYGFLYSPRKMFSEAITYYYHSPAPEIDSRDHIKWLINNYRNHSGYANYYTTGWNTNKFYVYQYDTNRILAGVGNTPENLSNGNFSNEELTILRRPIQNYNDYQDYPVLFVNHENSSGNTGHEHSDQSSFILYYKDKQLLIDPGYRPSWFSYYLGKEWLASPFAHNVIMVNPYDDYYNAYSSSTFNLIEENELSGDYRDLFTDFDEWNDPADNNPNHIKFKYDRFEPIGKSGDFNNVIPINPSQKNYLISNSDVSHLQVEIDYDHPQSHYPADLVNDEINVKRNFYSFELESENPYFIIYDDLSSSDHTKTNEFMNQLHFALYPVPGNNNEYPNNPDYINDPSTDNGQFTYSHFENSVYLHGAMGSNGNSEYSIRDTLPQGLYFSKVWDSNLEPPQWMHKAMRAKVSTEADEQFVTLLIPSEYNNSPIEYANNNSSDYLTKLHFQYTIPDTYIGIKTENILYVPQEDVRFITESSFFMVETNSNFSAISKFIINSGGELKIRDMTGTRFEDISAFDTDYNAQEIIADWKDNELHITFKTEFNDFPKYKILRYGTIPENLLSKTEFGTYHPGTEPGERGTIENNIQNLAYDNEYFYVNYSIDELVTESLIGDELVVYQGSYSNITVPELLTLGTGDLLLSEPWTIPENCELKIQEGANLELNDNFDLTVDGQLTAIGTEEQSIVFDKASSSNWGKISINFDGRADMGFCKITNSIFPINNKGYVEIQYSEFSDCDRGIFLDNPSGYIIENSIISNCGYFGILLRNTHRPIYRSILRNNLITENNFGLWFYNASAYVEADTIFANKYSGIYCTRGSNPVIFSSSISATYYNSEDNPEIKIGGSSYPVVDRNRNDIIFNNGYSIYNMDTEPRDYRCSENWWGTTNELAISNSFYPTNWIVGFIPFSTEPNVGYEPPFGTGSLYREGLTAEINGDTDLAKIKYIQSIEEDIDDINAILSAARLINCSETNEEYTEIKEYYDNLQEDLPESELSKTVKLNNIFCTRKQGNHQEALTEYEILAETEQTFLDSIFTQLDIVYTYMEANSGGGRSANIRFLNSINELCNYREAKERETELWKLLVNNTEDGGIYSPDISKISLNRNYPNPFNPSTTISFSIPKFSKIQLTIYNVKGQKVKTLANDQYEKGIHSLIWNGVDNFGNSVSSGVYFYNLDVNGKNRAIKKCLLLK